MDVLDRQFDTITTNYASVAFWLSSFGAFCYLIITQLLLLGIHYSNQKVKAPTPLELNLIVTVLWCFYRALDNAFEFLYGLFVYIVAPNDVFTQYQSLRQESYSLKYWYSGESGSGGGWDGIIVLLSEVLVTWLVFQSLILFLDTILPAFRDIRLGNHQYLAVKVQSRVLELFDFGRRVYEGSSRKDPRVESKVLSKKLWEDDNVSWELIRLKRFQMSTPSKGQRTLNWDLTIDKNALKEMKETLGPPGGFGELGFDVASDRVSFGAMGIGTSFNLTFLLETPSDP